MVSGGRRRWGRGGGGGGGAYEFTHMQTHNLCDALNAY